MEKKTGTDTLMVTIPVVVSRHLPSWVLAYQMLW